MATHTVESRFTVRDDSSRNLNRIGQATRNVVNANGDYRDSLGRLRNAQGRFIQDTERASTSSRNLGESLLVLGKTLLGLKVFKDISKFIISSIDVFGDFEAQVNRVAAVSGATEKELEMLSKRAKEIGANTKLSASEVAGLELELAKLGFTTNQILDMTGAIGNLSIALGTDLAQSAEVAGKTLRQFSLDGDEAFRVANVIAEVSSSSAADMTSFSEAMKFAGTTAGSLGISLEEASAAVASLSNVGLEGTLAGTGLSKVMLELADSSSKASQMLKGYTGDADDLSSKLIYLKSQGLSVTEVFDIFGTIAGKSALALIDNSEAMESLEKSFSDGNKQLDEMTKKMSNGVNYNLDIMKSSLEAVKINIGESFSQIAVDSIQSVTKSLTTMNDVISVLRTRLGTTGLLGDSWKSDQASVQQVAYYMSEIERASGNTDKNSKTLVRDYKSLLKTLTAGTVKIEDGNVFLKDSFGILTNTAAMQQRSNLLKDEATKKSREQAELEREREEALKRQAEAEDKLQAMRSKKEPKFEQGNILGQDVLGPEFIDPVESHLKLLEKEKQYYKWRSDLLSELTEKERLQKLEADMADIEQDDQIYRELEAKYREHNEIMYTIAESGSAAIADIARMFNEKQIANINSAAQAEIDAIRNKGKRLTAEERKINAIKKDAAMEEYKIRLSQWGWDKASTLSALAVAGAKALATPTLTDDIAVAIESAKLVADVATSRPTPPKLEEGAFVRGSGGGTLAIVGEKGYDEEIFGMGPAGVPRRQRFASEVASMVNNTSNYSPTIQVTVQTMATDTDSLQDVVRDAVVQGIQAGKYPQESFNGGV